MGRYEKPEDVQEASGLDCPPFTVDLLECEIRRLRAVFRTQRKRFPEEIPVDGAAMWWIKLQKPANERTEAPRQMAVTGQSGQFRWYLPYYERIASSLREYVKLSDRHRDFVRAAKEDGVWYNGDSAASFMRIYEETMRMKEVGFEAYRADAVRGLKRLIAKSASR